MKRTFLIIVVSLLFFTPTVGYGVAAQNTETVTIQCEGAAANVDVDTAVSLYESNTDKIPDVIKPALESNTTHLHIDGAETSDFTVEMADDYSVKSVTVGEPDNPDVMVKTDRRTACSVVVADDPVSTFLDAYNADEIDIRATGPVSGPVTYVIETVTDVADAVSGLLS